MSGSTVQQLDLPEVEFFMEPYIPKDSIVLLHGKFGTYKTPITTHIAKQIATCPEDGTGEFIGCKIQKAKCYYIQADTPKNVIIPRLQALNVAVPGIDFNFSYPGFNIVDPYKDEYDAYYYDIVSKMHRENKYDIVFIDSLRAIHRMDDKEATTVHAVYAALRKTFPGATLVLIHHDKKFSPDGVPGDESFSGSQAWANHATVALHVVAKDKDQGLVSIHHTKSQASEQVPNLELAVKDGVFVSSLSEANMDEIEDYIRSISPQEIDSFEALDKNVADYFGISPRTVRRRRKALMNGRPSFRNLVGQRFNLV